MTLLLSCLIVDIEGEREMIKKMYGKTWTCKKTSPTHVSCKIKKSKTKKSKAKKGGRKSHKGHRTKRGLAQDQRLKSKEPHEKAYRKAKRAGKR